MPTEKGLTGYPSLDKPWLKYYKKEDVTQIFPKQTLFEHILDRNKGNLKQTALNYFGVKVSYKDLFAKIDLVAKSFVQMGVKEGDIVSFCMPTTPETTYITNISTPLEANISIGRSDRRYTTNTILFLKKAGR